MTLGEIFRSTVPEHFLFVKSLWADNALWLDAEHCHFTAGNQPTHAMEGEKEVTSRESYSFNWITHKG